MDWLKRVISEMAVLWLRQTYIAESQLNVVSVVDVHAYKPKSLKHISKKLARSHKYGL